MLSNLFLALMDNSRVESRQDHIYFIFIFETFVHSFPFDNLDNDDDEGIVAMIHETRTWIKAEEE